MENMDKGVLRKELLELLVSGGLEKAVKILKDNEVSAFDFKDIAEKAFRQSMKDSNIEIALSVCEHFSLPAELKIDAISAQFRVLGDQKEFANAFEWGIRYNMSKNDMNNLTIKAFNDALKDKNVLKALEYVRDFEISPKIIVDDARRSFNELYEAGLFLEALYLGKEFEMSPKRTLTSGLNAYQTLLSRDKIKDFIELEKSYGILHDRDIAEVEDKPILDFSKLFFDIVVFKYFEQNKSDKLQKILDSIKFFENTDQNKMLPEMVSRVKTEAEKSHSKLLYEERGPAAVEIVKNFRLLEDETHDDLRMKIIKSAEETHHKLMKNNNLKGALFLKESYNLFVENALENSQAGMNLVSNEYFKNCLNNGNIEDAKTVIKKYEIHETTVTEIASKAIRSFAVSEQYGMIIEIMKEFKLDIIDPDTLSEITAKFHLLYESDQMELASNLDFYFKLKESRAKKATLAYWESLINKGNYSEALALKKERKISKKVLEPVLKNIYESMKNSSKLYDANKLKDQYHLKMSFWTTIMQMIKKVFGG